MTMTTRCEIECKSTFQKLYLIKRPVQHQHSYRGRSGGAVGREVGGVTVSTNLLTNRILRDGVPVVREEEEEEERVEFFLEGDELRG